MNDFPRLLESFFQKYLPVERGCSINTTKNYRDAFVYLLEYLKSANNLSASQITMEKLEMQTIVSFLDWLETDKRVSVSTRNNRLAAMKSFFKYVSFREPMYLNQCNSVLAIKAKKTETVPMNYLTIAAIELLFQSFDLSDVAELRDFCVIATLYETGARASELISIRCYEVRTEGPATVVLHGKGGKTRITPIDKTLAGYIKKYISAFRIKQDDYLFMNSQRKQLTRRGVDYILQKHFLQVKAENPDAFPAKLSPHCLRHSRAMHLLENDVELIYIRDLLGHSSVTTTEIYSKANPEIKRKHIQNVTKQIIDHDDFTVEQQEDLLSWLKKNL